MKENEKKSNKQSNILLIVIILFAFLVSTGVFLSKNFKSTFAAGGTVTFRGDSGYNLSDNATYGGIAPENGECSIDANGFLDVECARKIARVCCTWASDKSGSYPAGCSGSDCSCNDAAGIPCQHVAFSASDLFTRQFSNGQTYYCYYGSSNTSNCPQTISEGCYQCTKDGSTVYQKAINATRAKAYAGASSCNSSPVADSYCNPQPENACYQCTADATVFKWSTNGNADSNCSGGYTKTTKTQSECKYVAPENACYQCTANATVFKWSTNGNADSNCSGGYTKTTKTQSECKYVAPENACYQCTANATVFKWSTNGNADSNCSGGYTKTTKTQSECKYVAPTNQCYACVSNGTTKYIEATNASTAATNTGGTNCQVTDSKYCKPIPVNPKTGTAAIIVAWVVGLIALGYSVFYAIKVSRV